MSKQPDKTIFTGASCPQALVYVLIGVIFVSTLVGLSPAQTATVKECAAVETSE